MLRISAVMELYCWFDERRYNLLHKRIGPRGQARSDSHGGGEPMHAAADSGEKDTASRHPFTRVGNK